MVKFPVSSAEFTEIINKAQNYYKLKENIVEKSKKKCRKSELMKDGKKMGIVEIIKQNE